MADEVPDHIPANIQAAGAMALFAAGAMALFRDALQHALDADEPTRIEIIRNAIDMLNELIDRWTSHGP